MPKPDLSYSLIYINLLCKFYYTLIIFIQKKAERSVKREELKILFSYSVLAFMENEGIGRRSVRTLSSLLIGKAGGVILSAITFIIVARLLGPSGYGIYTLAVGIYSFIGAVGHLGIGTYFNKHISEFIYKEKYERLNEVLSAGYSILFPVAILLMLVGIVSSGLIASYFRSQSLHVLTVIIASFVLFFSMTYGALYPALVSFGRGKWAAYSIIIIQLANLVGSVFFILIGLSYDGALLGLMLSYLVGLVLTAHYIKRAMEPFGGLRLVRVSFSKIKNVLSFSLPMAANNFVNNGILNFGIMMLGIYASSVILGNYGAAMKGLNLIQTFYATTGVVLLPTFAAIVARRKRIERSYNKVISYSLLINLPVIIYIGIFAKPMFYILVTNKYSLAPLYLLFISIGVAIGLPALYTAGFIVSKGCVTKVLKYNTISAIAQLIALLFLIPYLKAIGVILSLFIIGGLVNDFLFIRGVERLFNIRPAIMHMAKIIFANLILALILLPSFLLHNVWLILIVGLLISLFAYPIIIALMHLIGDEFIRDLRNFSKGLPLIEGLINIIINYVKYFID